ncbi:uncharacterized protein LOC130898996 [Diorhabda carinulata]|uniref:uncharacterized protein LOC130443209 n=1 Tax=Diorhabda sublineata TaxID=1163346 RepID=UPI0024E13488|nr:uncharacterized protein LOC130443209 [Diorhabda sublineata]XP_057664629.1 uncharacterized protein LOC130898996 [Diorhabda carinulata]XP_057664630.1 uncharacterized protein LOC130898996 [Diorhabda carinulata]
MHQGAFLSTGWTRGGASEVVRRAHPASGAQWNVQVVRGKVNGKCLWNACKALSLGLLLMVLGAAMATIGYYADHLSATPEFKGNFTFRTKNETKSFHLNNLSYAGPIVMGVGGFIVVAACVMTFEARDSAAKVVPARFKLSTTGPPSVCGHGSCSSRHSSLKTSAVQVQTMTQHPYTHQSTSSTDRRALTQSFLHFSRGLALETQQNKNLLKLPQGSINRSPSAPDLVLERTEQPPSPHIRTPVPQKSNTKPKTFAACALLNPGLLQRHALSVDETAGNYRLSNDSIHPCGSQGSMAMDLHLECPVTLRIKDKRRNPLKRQRRVDEEVSHVQDETIRRSSHSCSVKLPNHNLKDTSKRGGSAHQLPTHYTHCRSSSTKRRSSNASDVGCRSRPRKRDCAIAKGKLERAISSDSRLPGVSRYPPHRTPQVTPEVSPQISPQPTRAQNSLEVDPGGNCEDIEVRLSQHSVHFSNSSQK